MSTRRIVAGSAATVVMFALGCGSEPKPPPKQPWEQTVGTGPAEGSEQSEASHEAADGGRPQSAAAKKGPGDAAEGGATQQGDAGEAEGAPADSEASAEKGQNAGKGQDTAR